MTSRFLRAIAALTLAAAAASPALAQRVIRIVVPFGPGAVQDTVARTFNNELGKELGASVIVENRAGAGGTIGTSAVAKSTDNNTLVLAAASHTLAGHLYSKLDYDPIKSFTGVANIGYSGYVIAAPGNMHVNNLAEYVKAVKAQQGKLNYASAGNGSATHLGMAYFLAKAGLEMQHVPMKSTGDAVNEVLAGRVQGVTSSLIGVMGFKSDPRIKILAYTGTQRSKFMPELPTAAEAGVPGYKFDSWIGVLAPSTMPKAEADKLNAAINKVLQDPAVQQRLANMGVEVAGNQTVDQFQKVLKDDYEQAGALVKASGARIE
ncbi:tripartite tricarboxylate transporter substrate-binding protein [Ramlibacter humi]|uniref:Tripartite tricarboxylate transporter substrate binding protein n=1 Tax=Ramlibacter humi TaxID=2530451 RepID=A0A4Z0BZC0_9BURK|nr:tripartite tricarboxylate transporter substrate-binding protein [Ramlibacter humi]TFZ03630.1 tripartite tricarboxylate transporter substrate binding protein [Ramlibacter humi]